MTKYNIHSIFEVADDAVLTPEEISEIVGFHSETVRRWCRSGKLDCYNFGGKYVIVGSEFKAFMERSRCQEI
ncbi:helix-turn-helix domain-containing protein [Bacillus sp. BRMEA1]|uniref:helix-turn-helix domain-containing protein n=1 Tax=Neobacillus endophyticus TaxID=2738405 RepID=UPI001566E7B6|nr:helix-turn-helix domain-containing protein [Neobacillus endophyticus]NRD80144.1 helix-turn-helix domain-containing protein [Neobacillus endophyticus]